MSKLTENQIREWLVRERDYWRHMNREGWTRYVAQGTEIPMEEALDQLIDVLGPPGPPDEIVAVIDARLGAGWSRSLARALGPSSPQQKGD